MSDVPKEDWRQPKPVNRGPNERQPKTRKKPWMRLILLALLILLLIPVVMAGYLVLVPVRIDLSGFAGDIDRQMARALGRGVSIDGGIVLVTGRRPSLEIEKVTVSNPEGWETGGRFAYLERFKTVFGLRELLRREIDIDDIIIEGLEVALEEAVDGRRNWEGFAAPSADEDEGGAFDLDFTELGSIAVDKVLVTSKRGGGETGKLLRLERLDGSALRGKPMEFELRGRYLGLPLFSGFKGGTLTELREGVETWPMVLKGKLADTSIRFEGDLSLKTMRLSDGLTFELEIPKLEQMIPITGELPPFGSIYLAGEARRTGEESFSIPEVSGKLGESPLEGALELDFSGKVPEVDGWLALDSLDTSVFRNLAANGDEDEESEVEETVDEFEEGRRLPFVGKAELRIKKVEGLAADTEMKDLFFKMSLQPGEASAELDVVFADAPLKGRLSINRKGEDDIVFDLVMEGSDAELTDIIHYYSSRDRTSGQFSSLNYSISGRGETLVDAWIRRSVLMEVEDAEVLYQLNDEQLRFHVAKGTMDREPGEPGLLEFTGSFENAPIEAQLGVDEIRDGESFRLRITHVEGKVGDATFRVENRNDARQEPRKGWGFHLDVSGSRLDKLDDIYKMDLPPLGPYSLDANVWFDGAVVAFEEAQLKVGSSLMNGNCRIDQSEDRPKVDLEMTAKTLQLDDFRGDDWSPTGSEKSKKTASDGSDLVAIFSFESLSQIDADAHLDVGNVMSGKDSLGGSKGRVRIENARLSVDPLTLGIPGGEFKGSFFFHPKANKTLDWGVNAEAKRFQVGLLARRFDSDSPLSGLANATLDLEARGVRFATPRVRDASGRVDLDFCPENLDAGSLDIWATNLILALLPDLDRRNNSEVNCLIARLRITDGIVVPEVLGLDTTTTRIVAEGKIDLKKRIYDLKLSPVPKRPQILTLQVPLGVTGTLTDPEINMGRMPVLRSLAGLTGSTLLFPARFLTDERLPTDGSDICSCAKE